MSVLGINQIHKRIQEEDLIEGLGARELKNPEGVGVDLRLGAVHRIVEGGAFIEADPSTSHSTLRDEPSGSDSKSSGQVLGKRKGVKIEAVAEFDEERDEQPWVTIKPGEYYLVTTHETINTPSDLMPLLFPRTSLFRSGLLLLNSKTDPGYKGKLTMGLKNLSEFEVRLQLGARICNIVFFTIEGSTVAYRGQHQGGRVSPQEVEKQV